MRLGGSELKGEYRRRVLLPRPDGTVWGLTLQPLRLGFGQWLKERGVVEPVVPMKIARDAQGRPVRDGEGLVLRQREEGDGAYLREMDRYHERMAMLMVWESLRGDGEVEFATPVPSGSSGWCEFADRLAEELTGAGFCAGDVIWLCEQIGALSNLAGEHLRRTQQDFFSEDAASRVPDGHAA